MSFYLSATGSILMGGPTGIMVPLGIELIPNLSLAQIYMYYNYIAICIMVFIAAMAGAKSESRFLCIIPILGGIFTIFGWIHITDSAGTIDVIGQFKWYALLVVCGILGVFSYMNDTHHEKYGIAGPGSKLLNLVAFIILFQAAVGCVNNANFWDSGSAVPTPNACTVGYSCDAYGNIQLTSSVSTLNNSGGLQMDAVSLVMQLGVLAIAILKFVVTVLTSVTLFSVVLDSSISGIFPGISASVYYIAIMGLIQVGIWFVYALTLFTYYYKPMPGEGTI